jgi:serine phosphatase RsbU (regulator of sigma subunit)
MIPPQIARWHKAGKYWRTIPRGAFILLLTGIACVFTACGLLQGLIDVKQTSLSTALIQALQSAIFGTALAWAALRVHVKWMIGIIILQLITIHFRSGLPGRKMGALGTSLRDSDLLQQRIHIEAVLATLFILAGYSLFITFMRKEGLRVFGPMTEIRLATETQSTLVPPIALTIGVFEFHGASVSSGAVGGDLVDVIEEHPCWLGYVADVSGHGVAAGMIMAMVKSATRMGMAVGSDIPALLFNLNRVLISSCTPNTFVTFASISGNGGNRVEFSLAGHLPILHYRRATETVEEHLVSNLPLGVVPDAKFEMASIDCGPGDLLVVLTDGLTEVSDAGGHELGLAPLKSILRDSAGAPLSEVMAALRDRALQHGEQFDDQTALLLRCKGI